MAEAVDCPLRDRTESEGYGGVQTYLWMTKDNVVEVPLLEVILDPLNLNKAYQAVMRNDRKGGIGGMSCSELKA